jgi:hypothetical protein
MKGGGVVRHNKIERLISDLGHRLTFAGSKRKSDLPPKPDIKRSDQTSASRATDITGS